LAEDQSLKTINICCLM